MFFNNCINKVISCFIPLMVVVLLVEFIILFYSGMSYLDDIFCHLEHGLWNARETGRKKRRGTDSG